MNTLVPSQAALTRRSFLRALGAFFAVTSANCSAIAHALAGPDVRTHPAQYFPGSDAYSPVPLTGCTLTGDAAQSFRARIRPLPSTGNPFFDQRFRAEYQALVSTMGHPPSFAFLDDAHAANAIALNVDVVSGTSPFGAILFGVRLLAEQLRKPHPVPLDNAWTIAAIMAHEWTHIVRSPRGCAARGRGTRN